MSAICAIIDCGREVRCNGLCNAHYKRMIRGADLGAPVRDMPWMTRRAKSLAEKFASKFAESAPDECWIWIGARNSDGYGSISHKGKTIGAHRVAWELTSGPIPRGLSVLHHCDNPPCVNPAHLWLGTQLENIADRAAKGRTSRTHQRNPGSLGESNHKAKLTEDDVRGIRARHATGERQCDLARAYGVCQVNISAIVRRETWKHVQ